LQPVIAWFWQLQRLLVCFVEFVDEDAAEASQRGAVMVARGAVVAARAREGEQDFAGEAGDHEHGRMAWYEPGQGWRQEENPHIGVAVSAMVVREPAGGPRDSIGGTSSVGMAAASIASGYGVETAATTRRPGKTGALTAAGADHVLVDDGGSLAASVHAVWPGGPDYVLDLVGASTTVDSLRLVRQGGTVCVAGSLQRVIREVEAGVYRPNVDRIFGLDDIVAAHRYMENNQATGKLVMMP
jgi:Zinc-binding dehydrogenase